MKQFLPRLFLFFLLINLSVSLYSVTITGITNGQEFCINDTPDTIFAETPGTKIFFGTGITHIGNSGNIARALFDPAAAGIGTHNITYDNPPRITITVTVSAFPATTLTPFAEVCIDEPAFALTGGSPAGGVYSGPGVDGLGNFDPAVAGAGTHTISYTNSTGTCSSTALENITVNALPTITLIPYPDQCEAGGAVVLTQASPAGGTYSGIGVSAGSFYPTVSGVGTFLINYSYTDVNGCSNSQSDNITVNPLPAVSFATLDANYCQISPAENLTGNPTDANGVFTGNGIFDNSDGTANFIASVAGLGNHTITYTYTDINNCVSSQSQSTQVGAVLTLNGLAASYCANITNVPVVSTPGGGTYTATAGLTDNLDGTAVFNPSVAGVGFHTIEYIYNDGSCDNVINQQVEVVALPTPAIVGLAGQYCINDAALTISGNYTPGGTFSGPGITDNLDGTAGFDPASLAVGGPYDISYSYTNPTGCSSSTTSQVNINPLPTAGISGTATICEGDNTPITINLTGTTPFDFTYTTGAINTDVLNHGALIYNTNVNPVINSTYTISNVTDGNGCSNTGTGSAVISVDPQVTITSQPVDLNVCPGSNTNFSITASGVNLSYQWQKDGVDIAGATNPTLPLNSVDAASEADYTCVVSSTCGGPVTSDIATLVLWEPTSITTQPIGQYLCTGDNLNLEVIAAGSNLTYQWKKDNVNIPGETFSTIIISNITTAESGVYTCEVNGECGLVESDPALVDIDAAIVITSQPVSLSACPGDNISFNVAATGTNLSYQWQLGGVDILGQTSQSLIINNVDALDAGNYRCVISSACGASTISSVGALVVNTATSITSQPSDATECENGNIGFQVVATGSSLTYQWYKDGVSLVNAGSISGVTSDILTITGLVPADAGNYLCSVSGTCANIDSDPATLVVDNVISITAEPISQTSCEGNNISFTVVATGSNLSYQWQKDGAPIGGATNATLNVNSVTAANNGDYRCVVSNSCGASVNSNIASLTINPTTTISTHPISSVECIGNNINLTTLASGSNLTYQWYNGAVPLIDGGDISGALSNSLIISNLDVTDAGGYYCQVSGDCGSPNSDVAAISIDDAIAITTEPADVQACDGDNISFSVMATGSNLSYQWQKSGVDIAGATNSVLTINTISALDEASYRCIISNSCGASINSQSASLILYANTLITLQPVDFTECIGGNASYNITATGDNLNYQWKKDGVNLSNAGNISGALTNTLNITGIAAGDNGIFTCEVTGNCGAQNSDPANLILGVSTGITTHPVSQDICENGNAVFNITATGTNNTYQWEKNGIAIPGATNSGYIINNVTPADAGVYRCVVTGDCGSVNSNGALLTISEDVVITSQPVNDEVCETETSGFSITATGNGLTYQWKLNGTGLIDGPDVSGSNLENLIINPVTSAYSGNYYCVVSGTCSNENSNTVSLVVNNEVVITVQPQNIIACPSDNVMFNLTATGTGVSYQWQKNEVDIVGETNSALLLNNVNSGDAGLYRCIVTGTCGAEISSAASLTVNEEVNITIQPTNKEVCEGSSTGFTVAASGAGLSYQWKKAGVSLVDGGGISGATSNNLTINPTELADAGAYVCEVTGTCSSTNSVPAGLAVDEDISIATQPLDNSACPGEDVVFNVDASGTNLTYQWQKNGVNIAGETNSGLLLNAITNADAGVYRCEITGDCGVIVSTGATLTVGAEINITSQPVDAIICENSSAGFIIAATGTSLTYQWKHNGANLVNDGIVNGSQTSSLSIDPANMSHNGVYVCEVNGLCGTESSNSVNLTINENISITAQPVNLTTCEGTNANFSIAASGTNLTYQWQKDGVNIVGETNPGLNLLAVTTADQGVYRCVVTGNCGTVYSNGASLTVDLVASITTQPDANPVLCEGDNINISVEGTGSNLTYQWQKGGIDLIDAGTTTGTLTENLIISTSDVSHDGIYTCIITGSCGSVNSSISDVVVHPTTSVITQPVSYSIVDGGNASFSVAADGNALTYQWQKDGVNLSDGGIISGATTTTLNLTGVSAVDMGAYRCVVSGTCNVANSNPANLIVNPTSIITTQPINITQCEGLSAAFNVVASGTGNTYQWRKDGVDLINTANIIGATSANLSINVASLSDAGAYTCIVNTESSVPAILTVNENTTITTQPIAGIRCEGDAAIFSVIASGTGMSYQWQKDGVNIIDGGTISGATNSVLNISGTTTGNAGNYRCIVTGTCGVANSDPALLSVNTNTLIAIQPLGTTLCEGASHTFNITAVGSNLSYLWKKDGVALIDGGNISGTTTSNLTVSGAELTNAGSYTCEVTGTCGTVNSIIAQLFVEEATRITLQPIDATGCDGDNITFSVLSEGTALSYQWQKDGVNMADGGTISGTLTQNLSISNIIPGNEGYYVCIVSGNCGTENSDPALLTSYATTAITVQPANDTICEGQTTTFSITASGDNLSYQWQKNGVNITDGGNITGATTQNLNISPAILSDAGSYTCNVSGSCGNEISNLAELVVKPTTQIIQQPADVDGCEGDNISFSVIAQGYNLNYQWQKDGVDLVDGGSVAGSTTDLLSISGIIPADDGSYRCIVTGTCNTVNSSPAILNSYSTTAISIQPTGATVCENSPVTLSTTVVGDNLAYQWYKDGVSLVDNVNISGSSTSILSIANAGISDEGTYTIQVNGTCGSEISDFAIVDVDSATTISLQPINAQGCEGDNISLSVITQGHNLNYQWQKDGVNLTNGGTISGANSSLLLINGIVPSDDGAYRSVVSGACGVVNSNVALLSSNINTQITSQPVTDTVCEGNQVTLSVVATGNNLSYIWKKDGVVLSDGGNISGSATSSLIINNSTLSNTGIYSCEVSGSCGTENSSPASVVIRSATTISLQPQSFSTCEGDMAVFSIAATGENLSYLWQKNVTPLSDGGNIFGSTTTILTINNLTVSDIGTYNCVITGTCNTINTDAANLQIDVYPSAAGVIVGPASVCRGDSNVVFEVAGIANADYYIWSLPVGATITSGDSTRFIEVGFSNNELGGNITVYGKNACGTGIVSPVHNVIANPIPTAIAGSDQSICIDNSVLDADHPGTATGTWSIMSGPATVTNLNLHNSAVNNLRDGTNTFVWNVAQNGCSSNDTVIIQNNHITVEAGIDKTICTEDITLEANVPSIGATGSWSVTTGIASFIDGNNPVTVASGFAPGLNVLRWTIVNGSCSDYDTIIVDNQAPTDSYAGIDQSICNTSTVLSANTPSIGTGNWSVISGAATFGDNTNPNTTVTNLGMGDNILRWTTSNGVCSSIDETTISNNQLVVDAGIDLVLCDHTTTLAAVAPGTGIGNWSVALGSAAFVNYNSHNTIVTDLAKGDNLLVWNVNNNGCISSDTIQITNDSPTDSDAGDDQVITDNFSNLQGNIPAVGTGAWSLTSGSAVITDQLLFNTPVTNLALGENTFRWTISHNSCISFDEVIINNFTPTNTDAGPDQTLCSDETTLAANEPAFGFGEWSVIQGSATFTDLSEFNTTVTGLAPGDNILRWTVWQNGYTSDDVVITNNSPTISNAGADQTLCVDSTILSANNPIIGKGLWTVISGSGIFENDTIYNTKVQNMAKGENIYKWTLINNTCLSEDLVIINNDLPTPADAGSNQTICTNSTLLTPNTPTIGTGTWSVIGGSAVFSGNSVNNLSEGNNILRWTIVNNSCELYDEITIINNTPSDAQAGADKVICYDSISLAASPPAIGTGTWSIQSGSATISNLQDPVALASNLAQGATVFRWTVNNNGCTVFDEVVVDNSLITASVGSDQTICSETTILEANNPAAGTGQWSVLGGSGSATFDDVNQPDTRVSNLDKGDNILRWTIANNICETHADVIITNNTPSTAFAGPDVSICTNNTTLQGNTPIVGTGEWTILSGAATLGNSTNATSNISQLSNGVNTLQWTISNAGCTSSDQVVISNNATIESNAGTDATICSDSTILYANNPSFGLGQWSVVSGSATFTDNNNYNTQVYELGKGQNILRWFISNGDCSSTDEVVIVNNSPTTAVAGADQTICGDNTTMFANNPIIGTGTWELISGAANFNSPSNHNSGVTGLNPGLNTLRWKIEYLGCVSNDDVEIYNDLPSFADAGSDMELCANSASLLANNPGSGSGQWSVISGSGTFETANSYSTNITDLGFGNNTLRWTVNYAQCETYDEIVVTNNQFHLYAGVDQTVSESKTLLAANNPSAGTGTWSVIGGSGTFIESQNSITSVTNIGAGLNTYRWSIDINGCISYDDVLVTYNVLPEASFVITENAGCPPLDVFFVNNSLDGLSFIWDFGDGATSTDVTVKHTYLESGDFEASLTIFGENGEVIKRDTIITVYKQPEAAFLVVNKEVYIPEEEALFINKSTDATEYLWEFGNGSTSTESDPRYIYETPGTYDITLHVWSDNECYDSVTIASSVEVLQSGSIVFPNAFTPNTSGSTGGAYNPNDFSNDVFFPIGEGIEQYHLEIFNKWGIMVFESKDIEEGWDGYSKGRLLEEGVYVWKVTGAYNNGKEFKKVGTVLLIR